MNFVQLAGGMGFTCGITSDQTVFCWGTISGQVQGLFKQITADGSDHFVCGVLIDGSIRCWGHSPTVFKVQEQSSKLGLKFVQISCSSNHCCALDMNGMMHATTVWFRSLFDTCR